MQHLLLLHQIHEKENLKQIYLYMDNVVCFEKYHFSFFFSLKTNELISTGDLANISRATTYDGIM